MKLVSHKTMRGKKSLVYFGTFLNISVDIRLALFCMNIIAVSVMWGVTEFFMMKMILAQNKTICASVYVSRGK